MSLPAVLLEIPLPPLRDPRGGGFDPGDAAAFAAASAPSLPGVPQGQSGFASRGG